jgi:LPS export ABC transporter permease LptF
MKLLDRYIARQVFVSAFYAVTVILVILILGNVFKEILRELAKRPELSLGFVLRFILLVIPISLGLAIPFSFLTAILLVFGRLSADSEFVSMRMAGLSMGRICAPVGALALFFTAICGFVNVTVTPWAKSQMEEMKSSLFNQLRRDPMFIFPDQQVMDDLPDHLVFAHKEDGLLSGLQIIKLENAMPQAIVVARQAKVSVDLEGENPALLFEMSDVNIMARGEGGDFMEATQPVFMQDATVGVAIDVFKERGDNARTKPSNLPLPELFARSRDPSLEPSIRTANRTELSRRFAFSVSCLTFALIGVPLGIVAQRRENSAGFVLSMVIAVVYYALLNVASMMREREEMRPDLLMWVPNLLFLGLGIYLFWRLSRK